jgi:hypothetical protein
MLLSEKIFLWKTRFGPFLAQIRVKNFCLNIFFKKFEKSFFQNHFKKFPKYYFQKKYYFKKFSKNVFCSTKSILQN